MGYFKLIRFSVVFYYATRKTIFSGRSLQERRVTF
jgi:hypothetical protein|tara:strand:- start:111 stop:215 length:105 start_codon:yes stop_codon:yes gene_type:complete